MSSAATGQQYSIANYSLEYETTEQLQTWANDPNCREAEQVGKFLAQRLEKEQAELQARRKAIEENPFNAYSDVSADAKYIAGKVVKHLWIIFVLLPIVLAILYSLLK